MLQTTAITLFSIDAKGLEIVYDEVNDINMRWHESSHVKNRFLRHLALKHGRHLMRRVWIFLNILDKWDYLSQLRISNPFNMGQVIACGQLHLLCIIFPDGCLWSNITHHALLFPGLTSQGNDIVIYLSSLIDGLDKLWSNSVNM